MSIDSKNAESVSGRSYVIFDYLSIAAPAFSTPLLLWAQNYVGVGHPERLVLIGAVAWLTFAALLSALRAIGMERNTSLVLVWIATYTFMRFGSMVDTWGYLVATLLVVAILGIIGFLIHRRPSPMLRTLVFAASALLVVEVALAAFSSAGSLGENISVEPPAVTDVEFGETPDIVVVVADAYVGDSGLRQFFDESGSALTPALIERGFQVPRLAFSPYVTTRAALPSMFDMHYSVEAGEGMTKGTSQRLYERIGGDNRLVETLLSNGYHITMLESGWSGSICGENVDTCVPSAFLDESTFFTLDKTWLGKAVLDKFGYSFTVGAKSTADWLDENLEQITSNDRPDLVFAHLEVPHPPLFLRGDCEVDTSHDRSGVTMQWPGVSLDSRKAAYLEQIECVDSMLTSVADLVSPDTVVVLAGDHGSDAHNQLAIWPDDWSVDATHERLNVMLAVRAGDDCSIDEPAILSNVFRTILGCLSGQPMEPLPPRLFRYAVINFDGAPSPIRELEAGLVEELLEYEE